MKITFTVFMQSNGDGSASPMFFPNKEAAEKFAAALPDYCDRLCDDIGEFSIIIDDEGNLVQPHNTILDEERVLRENYSIGRHRYNKPTDYSVRWRGGK